MASREPEPLNIRIREWIVASGTIVAMMAVLVGGFFSWSGLQQSRQALEIAQRAYLVIEATITDATGSEPPVISIDVTNRGLTPAVDLTWLAGYTVSQFPQHGEFVLDRATAPSRSTVGPGGMVSKTVRIPSWQPAMGENIVRGNFAIYAFGEVSYRDAFGKLITVPYLFMHGGDLGVRPGKMSATAEATKFR